MSATNLWRLLSLACVVVALGIMAPSCFDSDECTADPDACAGTTGTDTGTGET